VEYERRLTELQTRKQKKFEPTENFIYDTIELSKYCYEGGDDESAHVIRTKSKLLPELQLATGTTSYPTVLQLIEACEAATRTLEIRDETLGTAFSIPPMRQGDRKSDDQFSNKKSGESNYRGNGSGNSRGYQTAEWHGERRKEGAFQSNR